MTDPLTTGPRVAIRRNRIRLERALRRRASAGAIDSIHEALAELEGGLCELDRPHIRATGPRATCAGPVATPA